MIGDCIAVGIGGAFGAILRYLFSQIPVVPNGFPLTTILINIIGSFCVGLIIGIAGKSINFDPRLLLFVKIGLCGGFTTFSTFSVDALNLLQNGKMIHAAIYMGLSVILCVGIVGIAQALVK